MAAACVLAVAFAVTDGATGTQEPGDESPNVVFILADDLDAESAKLMPNIKSLIAEQGATFDNAFVAQPVCCPSRSTILTGMYSHNHEVLENRPPHGSLEKFRAQGHERRTIAAHLQPEGYKTGLFGKYMNGYKGNSNAKSRVPPNWNEWFATLDLHYYDWEVSDNGDIRRYGRAGDEYKTDVMSRRTTQFIRQSAPGRPFFAYVTPQAPHGPATPANRHEDEFTGAKVPRTPAFDETDMSDKPNYFRRRDPLTPRDEERLDRLYRDRLRSMLAVDEMVLAIVEELRASGELDNTYIFFTSDNGLFLGQHRLSGKAFAYDEGAKVPLFVRGPGIAPGTGIDELASNTDVFATVADMAGAPLVQRDGRSLLPLLRGEAPTTWRRQVLIEDFQMRGGPKPAYKAIVTRTHKYVKYATGEEELYDRIDDPYEVNSIHETADPALLASLRTRLDALKTCEGDSCREAEDAP